jgi:hypothetical protein
MSEFLTLERADELDEGYYDALADQAGEGSPQDRFGGFVVGAEVQIDHKRQIHVTDLTPNAQNLNLNVRRET